MTVSRIRFLLRSSSSRPVGACLIMAIALVVLPATPGMAQSQKKDIVALRETLQVERTNVVATVMQLTREEGAVFWPLYREYRSAVEPINESLTKLVQEYAALHPDVPETIAGETLTRYIELETRHLETRMAYWKKFEKALTAAKTLKLVAAENRLDMIARVKMWAIIIGEPEQAK